MRSLVTYRPYRPAPANFDRWFDSAFRTRDIQATQRPRRAWTCRRRLTPTIWRRSFPA